jgi:hypothetical protein
LFDVVSTIQPNLLDSAISSTPRMRDWMFSSVRSGSWPMNDGASRSTSAWWAASMAMVRCSTPRFAASASASVIEWSLEYREGMSTPWTRSAPRASAAMAATNDESTPPDRPITTSWKPFLVT